MLSIQLSLNLILPFPVMIGLDPISFADVGDPLVKPEGDEIEARVMTV